MPTGSRTVIVIPTYNEAENIRPLLASIHDLLPEVHLLVVDDDSPDGTWRLVEEAAQENPHIHLLHRTTERGRGSAGIAGFRWALDYGAKFVVEMDADFSHQPQYLPDILLKLKEADFVLGSRYVPGGRDSDRGTLRQGISVLANGYARWVLGVPIRDCTSGYRAYRAEVLQRMRLESIDTNGPAILSDMLFRIKLLGCSMAEVPIVFIDRQRGESTLTPAILLEGLWNILRLRLEERAIRASLSA